MANNSKDGYMMGLDFGTSNIKGAIYDLEGREIAFEAIEYDLYMPSRGIVENDINNYWTIIKKIIEKLLNKIDKKSEKILSIGTSSQGETIVPVDKNGQPLRNAIVWIDTRSMAEADEIRQNFDINEMYEITGQADVDTSWPASRIRWLRKNEPEIFKNTYKFLLLEDYIIYKLTGEFFGEAAVYGSSYYYDIKNFRFIPEMLDFLEIDSSKLPVINKPGTCVGNISEKCAAETGLSIKTKVVAGAMDQLCGAIGAGNVDNYIATETTGSAFAMVVSTTELLHGKESTLPYFVHPVPGMYALLPYSTTGGMVLKWFKDTFCQHEEELLKEKNENIYAAMDKMAEEVPAGCEGMIMIPHLCGALFPEYNYNAKGVYFGIGINSTKSYFIRAILEAIAFMMRQDLDYMKKLKIDVKKIISIGGGAKSSLWCRIKADICEINLEVPEYTETALLGAAVLGATGAGIFKDIKKTAKDLIKIKKIYRPDSGNSAVYRENYHKYIELYKSVEKLF